jgi:hypothetical protein
LITGGSCAVLLLLEGIVGAGGLADEPSSLITVPE